MRRVSAAAGLAVVLAASPSLAANKDVERLQAQINGLQTQISDVQRTAEASLQELKRLNATLAEQGDLTRRSLQDMRTQYESLQLAVKDLRERVGEVGERLQGMTAAAPVMGVPSDTGAAPVQGAVAPVAGANPPPAPRELYSQAYADYARGNYDVAVQGFQEYLRTYPDTEFSDNAQYWVGECYYGKQRYQEAIDAWNSLLRDFPSSDKLPDARFKKGLALEKLGRRSQALVEYRYVVDRYPNSEAGRKAREKLNAQ